MDKTPFVVGGSIFGVTFFAFALTMILTSVIITSDTKDTWIKPGEQVRICRNKKFTANPPMDGVIGHVFPTGINYNATEVRIANEVFDGTVTSKKMADATKFHANTDDIVTIEFESTSYSKVEVYYFKKMTKAAAKKIKTNTIEDDEKTVEGEGNENTIAPKRRGGHSSHHSSSGGRSSSKYYTTVRFVALSINGTGLISGSAVLPENSEYGIGVVSVDGATGYDYSINITYERKYYTSDEIVNCTSGVKTPFNSEKKKGYCVVFEMEYDGPITDPEASKSKLGLYCAQRYNTGDIIAISMMASLLLIGIIIFVTMLYGFSDDSKKKNVEMS